MGRPNRATRVRPLRRHSLRIEDAHAAVDQAIDRARQLGNTTQAAVMVIAFHGTEVDWQMYGTARRHTLCYTLDKIRFQLLAEGDDD